MNSQVRYNGCSTFLSALDAQHAIAIVQIETPTSTPLNQLVERGLELTDVQVMSDRCFKNKYSSIHNSVVL